MKNITVSIIGCCVSRDIFGITEEMHCVEGNDKYVVERYIQTINPLAAISKPIDRDYIAKLLEETKKSRCSSFFKRMFEMDLDKTYFEYLGEVKSDCLIIDMAELREPVVRVGDSYISYVSYMNIKRKIDTNLLEDSEFNRLSSYELIEMSDIDKEELERCIKIYIDKLKQLYPEEKIIVIETEMTNTYIDENTGGVY